MDNINNRQWEIYNLDTIVNSTEYENNLINKNIENYFDDLINKPVETTSNILVPKSTYSFEKFYKDYIEHNLLFIVLLVGIVFFLIIRYYSKDDEEFNIDKNNEQIDNFDNIKNKENEHKNKKIKRQLNFEKKKLFQYKKQLDNEKQKILSIIDELSNINDYDNIKNQNNYNMVYLNDDTDNYYQENEEYEEYNNNIFQYPNQQLIINDNKSIPHNQDDFSQYDNINKSLNNKTNEIDGLYIDPPFI